MSLLKKLGPLAGLAGLAAIIGTGGAAAPAVLAAEGAAGAGAAGGLLGGAATAGEIGATAGLLGEGAATGVGSQAAMLAGQNAGFGPVAQTMLADAAGTTAPLSTQFGSMMQQGKEAFQGIKPYTDAAGNASKALGQFQDAPVNMPQPGSKTDGGAASAQLFNSIQQTDLQRMQEELAKRQKMNSMFGGGNGWTA